MEEQLVINLNDVIFNNDGTVTIKNEELKNKLEIKINNSDLLAAESNNGACGDPEVNVPCPKPTINLICNELILKKDQLTFPRQDEIKIKNQTFINGITEQKLKGLGEEKLILTIKSYKQINE